MLSTVFSSDFFWHVLRLPYSFYLLHFTGEIANRMQLNDSVYRTLTVQLVLLGIDALAALAFGFAMYYYDPFIATLGILTVFANVFLIRHLNTSLFDYLAYFRQTSARSKGYTIGALASIETIKSSSAEYRVFSRWAGYYSKSLNASLGIKKNGVYLGVLPNFIKMLLEAAVLCFGAWRVIHGHLTVGMLFALTILMEFFSGPITRLVNFSLTAQMLKNDISRLNEVLTHPYDEDLVRAEKESEQAIATMTSAKLHGSIEIINMTFSYDPDADPVLKDISLRINPGMSVAIVGATGSGKSTLVNLISGLLTPNQGTIFLDGKPRNQILRTLLANSIAVVEQTPFLFSASIKDNISFFNPAIDQKDIIRAAQDACIHEDIVLRKGGYDLILHHNGSNLSGGQRQRLEIARVLARQPSILILDEATSAIDTETEKQIMENIRRRGCTCLIVAHRMSSTRYCDSIVVLDKGNIIAYGGHEDLLKTSDLYRRFFELEQKEGGSATT